MASEALRNPIVVSGVGLTTSLGRGGSACAAIRAGLSRARPTSEVVSFDPETFEPAALIAHVVHPLTEGFQGLGRWLQLAGDALAALRADGVRLSPAEWRRTRLCIATRPLDAEFLRLDSDEASPAVAIATLRERFVSPLVHAHVPELDSADVQLVSEGNVAVAVAVLDVAASFARASCDRAILLVVDSWVDPAALADAAMAQRVRFAEEPTGFVPGEAAAALLLEREIQGRHRPVRGLLTAGAVAREAESPVQKFGGPALAAVIERALPPGGAFGGDAFVDLNGEEWRAMQWGNALVRLGTRLGGARTRLVAGSVGDTGAASSAVALCTALESHRRGWARSRSSLVISAETTGSTACLGVEAAGA